MPKKKFIQNNPRSKVNLQFWHHPPEYGKIFHSLADVIAVTNAHIDASVISSAIDFYSAIKKCLCSVKYVLDLLLFFALPFTGKTSLLPCIVYYLQ